MANQKIIEMKQAIVNEIAENVKKSSSVVFFEYRGLSVGELTELRRKLRENDAELKVYKNTLTKRALDSLEINLDDELNGPKALAFGSDAVAPIKILNDFAKKHPALEMKVGIVEGEITGLETLKKLATIPSREVLLTMVASGMMASVRNLAIGLDLYAKQLENK
jgi:large subunit ribosomal protein L10